MGFICNGEDVSYCRKLVSATCIELSNPVKHRTGKSETNVLSQTTICDPTRFYSHDFLCVLPFVLTKRCDTKEHLTRKLTTIPRYKNHKKKEMIRRRNVTEYMVKRVSLQEKATMKEDY